MASHISPGYLSAIPPGRHPIFSRCLTAAIPPGYLNHHSTRPTSHFLWMSHSRHSTRIPQPPFHSADILFSLDVSQPLFHPDTSAAILPGQRSALSGCLTTAILSGRRSTFFGYFTPGACRRIGKEDDLTSNWAYKSRCLLS